MSNYFINLNYFDNSIKFQEQLPVQDLIPALQAFELEILESIKNLEDSPSSFSLILSLEKLFWKFDQATQMVSSLYNFNQDPAISEILEQAQNIKLELFNQLTSNQSIFNNLSLLEKTCVGSDLKLVEDWILTFKLNGCGLSPEDNLKLVNLDKNISSWEIKYNEIITQENYKTFSYPEADTSGVPEAILADAVSVNGHKLFNDNHSSDILTYAHNPHLRETAFRHSKTIGKTIQVEEILLNINHARQEKAKLLGYSNYVDFSLDQKMAKNVTTLNQIIDPIYEKTRTLALNKFADIEEFAKNQGAEKVSSWDYPYYSNLYTNKKNQIDSLLLKQHFPVENVWAGLLSFVSNNMKVQFKLDSSYKHGKLYQAFNQSQYLGQVYVDLFARENKMTGAWMDNFIAGGLDQKPIIILSCNFNDKDPYLDLSDINTLFHEMGHVLHGLLNHSLYPSIHGTNVVEDFVEFPSQFMENYVLEPEVLSTICSPKSVHIFTIEYCTKIKKYQYDNISTWLLAQLFYAKLDLKYHETKYENIEEIKQMEKQLYTSVYGHGPVLENFHVLHNFGHSVESGYAAGYYSYIWASIFEKDAFLFMSQNPNWNQLLNLYQTSGEDELAMYLKFRGQYPQVDFFLKAYLLE